MLDVSSWDVFHLYDIFDISMGNKMDKGKMTDGDVPFVGRTANNNGINANVGRVVNHERYCTVEPYPGGCLTLALGGSIGSCFYQSEPFYTSQNVAVLIPKNEQSELSLLFVSSVITYCVLDGKYGAFVEELNKHVRTDFIIKLPATPSGEPDWAYMEQYMRDVMAECERKYSILVQIAKERHLLDVSDWGEFRVGDLFETTANGKRVPTGSSVPMNDLIEGDIPRVTVTDKNNGIIGNYVVDSDKFNVYENFISVSFLGTVFYHDGRVSLDMKVHCLKPLDVVLNQYIGLFLCSVIKSCLDDLDYTNQVSSSMLPELMIRLPIDNIGHPDWDYMEQYMREVVFKERYVVECLCCL